MHWKTNLKFMLLLGLVCITSNSNATEPPFPWAKAHDSTPTMTIDQIRLDRSTTIGGQSVHTLQISNNAKDLLGSPEKLGYSSVVANETKAFSTPLDLTTEGADSLRLAVLADDVAVIKIYAYDESATGNKGDQLHTFSVRGGALWNPNSYKEDDYVLAAGSKYIIDLDYKNNVHWTDGSEVDVDGVSLYQCAIPSDTALLITHNPKWERNYAQIYAYCKQAELMGNKLLATCESTDSTLTAELWKHGLLSSEKVCDGRKTTGAPSGSTRFVFDTASGSSTDGAKTDSDGAVYIEGVKLDKPSHSSPSITHDYKVHFYTVTGGSKTQVGQTSVQIGPAIEFLSFPKCDILTKKRFDPYTHKYVYKLTSNGYGLQIDYNYYSWNEFEAYFDPGLLTIENATEAEKDLISTTESPLRIGVLPSGTSVHIVSNDDKLLKYNVWSHSIKWEGFDHSLYTDWNQYEKAQEVFMNNNEVDRACTNWAPEQTRKGAGAFNVIGEGAYRFNFGVKLASDAAQVHLFQIIFGVEHKKDAGDEDLDLTQ